ncbi:protein-glutamate O-methyltransferase CheR, partial [Myxococcota bacterium]|nr:protein-glutamate O-methyltransferase CheR [Myxococcota bacterium]
MSTWSDPGYEAIARLVGARTGLSFSGARLVDAEAGIRRALKRSGLPDLSGYLSKLALEARVFDELVDELTVHETYFFREPAHFELVRHELVTRFERRATREVRAWCAGCASGEEAYSLAILFEELGVPASAPILATDISRAALARARAARYRPWSFRGVDPQILERWFRRDGELWALDPKVVARVDLEHLNLALDSFPSFASRTSGLDVVFCRNVLIYLDPAVIERIAHRLFEALAPGGLLVPGPSDPPLGHVAPFDTLVTPGGLVYRKPGLVDGFAPLFAPSVLSRIPAPRPTADAEADTVPSDTVPSDTVPSDTVPSDRSSAPSSAALDGARRLLERRETPRPASAPPGADATG